MAQIALSSRVSTARLDVDLRASYPEQNKALGMNGRNTRSLIVISLVKIKYMRGTRLTINKYH